MYGVKEREDVRGSVIYDSPQVVFDGYLSGKNTNIVVNSGIHTN